MELETGEDGDRYVPKARPRCRGEHCRRRRRLTLRNDAVGWGRVSSVISAWVDESGSDPRYDRGAYLLGAVIALDDQVDSIRQAFSELKKPTETKIHWHVDSPSRRREVIAVMAEVPIEGLVVVRCEEGIKPERNRRKCLEVLIEDLERLGCGPVVFEARGAADNRRDRQLLDGLRRRGCGGGIRMDHVPGPKDPMLWIADALCGSVVAYRRGERSYLDMLDSCIEVKDIST